MSWLLSLLTGGVIQQFTKPLVDAYNARLAAQNDSERIAAEQAIARLEAARDIALAESSDRWSATRIGRLLIVAPFGLWWASVFAVSIINPLMGWEIGDPSRLLIDDIPPRIWDIAMILIPAVIVGDASALVTRTLGRGR